MVDFYINAHEGRENLTTIFRFFFFGIFNEPYDSEGQSCHFWELFGLAPCGPPKAKGSFSYQKNRVFL